ncbi:MAG: hypothetical protein V5A64_03890 [Candidatus Thermoplasmatota archaeon]
MEEEDQKKILEDFKKADIEEKLNMWFYAVEQEGIWEEMLDEMSKIARKQKIKELRQ